MWVSHRCYHFYELPADILPFPDSRLAALDQQQCSAINPSRLRRQQTGAFLRRCAALGGSRVILSYAAHAKVEALRRSLISPKVRLLVVPAVQ